MRCFRIKDGHVPSPPVELKATTDNEAITEAEASAARHDWTEFEVWDGTRLVFRTVKAPPRSA